MSVRVAGSTQTPVISRGPVKLYHGEPRIIVLFGGVKRRGCRVAVTPRIAINPSERGTPVTYSALLGFEGYFEIYAPDTNDPMIVKKWLDGKHFSLGRYTSKGFGKLGMLMTYSVLDKMPKIPQYETINPRLVLTKMTKTQGRIFTCVMVHDIVSPQYPKGFPPEKKPHSRSKLEKTEINYPDRLATHHHDPSVDTPRRPDRKMRTLRYLDKRESYRRMVQLPSARWEIDYDATKLKAEIETAIAEGPQALWDYVTDSEVLEKLPATCTYGLNSLRSHMLGCGELYQMLIDRGEVDSEGRIKWI